MFSQDIETGLRFSGFDALEKGSLYLEVASQFSSGPDCDDPSSLSFTDSDVVFRGVKPREKRTHDMLVVIHNYYSPSDPEGQGLSGLKAATTPKVNARLTCFGGPGAGTGSFMLDGTDVDDSSSVPAC